MNEIQRTIKMYVNTDERMDRRNNLQKDGTDILSSELYWSGVQNEGPKCVYYQWKNANLQNKILKPDSSLSPKWD